jgi:hypothetical protein
MVNNVNSAKVVKDFLVHRCTFRLMAILLLYVKIVLLPIHISTPRQQHPLRNTTYAVARLTAPTPVMERMLPRAMHQLAFALQRFRSREMIFEGRKGVKIL